MSQEIRKQIDEIYQEIENLLNPSSFVLKPEVAILNGEIKKLQKQCSHKFENGQCIYCDKEEK